MARESPDDRRQQCELLPVHLSEQVTNLLLIMADLAATFQLFSSLFGVFTLNEFAARSVGLDV